jgi:signal transduction histidine kinase
VRGIGFRRLPRWTLRLRLTLLYGALFLVAGAVLLGITYGLVHNASGQTVVAFQKPGSFFAVVQARVPVGAPVPPLDPAKVEAAFQKVAVDQRTHLFDALLTRSGLALGIMAIASIGLGWLVAGRALRPVRTMTARARGISDRNLHERIALAGPNDELKELADTFDGMLQRLQAAFESQRRFVANASHELRTPITVERTLVEVALADPAPSIDSMRETCERVLASTEQQERLIEALLTLARSQRGLDSREPVDLAAIVGEACGAAQVPDGVRIETELAQAPTSGDRALIERLVANLVDNAVRYNTDGGWVSARTGLRAGRPTLEIENTGPVVKPEQKGELLEPFRRLNGARTHNASGLGLGLSIVDAIASAHGAELHASPRPEGGLAVLVAF